MLKVERGVFEKAILQIVESTNTEELIREFSLHRIFFYSLLKDISKGEGSPNYHILKKIALNRRISEQSIVERAKHILSYLSPDELEEIKSVLWNPSRTITGPEDVKPQK